MQGLTFTGLFPKAGAIDLANNVFKTFFWLSLLGTHESGFGVDHDKVFLSSILASSRHRVLLIKKVARVDFKCHGANSHHSYPIKNVITNRKRMKIPIAE